MLRSTLRPTLRHARLCIPATRWGAVLRLQTTTKRASSTSVAAARNVTPAEAAALLPEYTYLDVRTPEEFKAGHAPGAVNVPILYRGPIGMSPNGQFMSQVDAAFPSKAQPLIVGCKAGNRSAVALQSLQQEYLDLVHNTGGWDAWVAAGLPVEK